MAKRQGADRVERAAQAIPLGALVYREATAPAGLTRRVIRALQLDPSLYREVATPGASTWQAVLVVALTAAASGIAWGTEASHVYATAEPAYRELSGMEADFNGPAGVRALAHFAAWPVWAAGLCAIARLCATPDRVLRFVQVARVLAFAQAPGLLAVLIAVLAASSSHARLDPDISPLVPLVFGIRTVVGVWVLLGTVTAVREVFGMSYGRTLGALVGLGVGLCLVAVLLGFVVEPALRGGAGGEVSVRHSPSVFDISHGLDFNLGLGLADVVVGHLYRLVVHGWF